MTDEYEEQLPNKQIKMIPRSLGGRRISSSDELKEARKSPAYWWYRTLQTSDEYLFCCKQGGKGKLESLYRDFGDVRKDFAPWWMTTGRKIFAETKPLKKVLQIGRNEIEDLAFDKDRMIIQIPLTMRKQTIMRQIGRHLKEAYANREVDIWKQSTAKRQITKSKIRLTTVEMLLKVFQIKNDNPTLNNYEIGLKAGIDLDILARDTSGDTLSLELEKRRMTIAVSRYLGQAKNLIANAEKGVFPSLQDPSKT
jgi:hypothetical protein